MTLLSNPQRLLSLPTIILMLAAAFLFVACGGDDDDDDGATPAASPTTPAGETPGAETPTEDDESETPTEEPEDAETPAEDPTDAPSEPSDPTPTEGGAYPPGTRTDDPQLDAIIEAIENGDMNAIADLLGYSQVKCVTKVEGPGSPPECPAGVPEDTAIDVIPMAECEGYYLREDQLEGIGNLIGDGELELFAVFEPTDPGTPEFNTGETVLLFLDTGDGFGRMVNVEGGSIVSVFSGCGFSPEQHLESRSVSDFILPPLS